MAICSLLDVERFQFQEGVNQSRSELISDDWTFTVGTFFSSLFWRHHWGDVFEPLKKWEGEICGFLGQFYLAVAVRAIVSFSSIALLHKAKFLLIERKLNLGNWTSGVARLNYLPNRILRGHRKTAHKIFSPCFWPNVSILNAGIGESNGIRLKALNVSFVFKLLLLFKRAPSLDFNNWPFRHWMHIVWRCWWRFNCSLFPMLIDTDVDTIWRYQHWYWSRCFLWHAYINIFFLRRIIISCNKYRTKAWKSTVFAGKKKKWFM